MRRIRSFPILATLALVIAACTSPTTSPPPAAGSRLASGGGTATGGTVRIGWAGYPDSLNPGNGVLSEAYTLYELVYDTPITVDVNGAYLPELATEWSGLRGRPDLDDDDPRRRDLPRRHAADGGRTSPSRCSCTRRRSVSRSCPRTSRRSRASRPPTRRRSR